MRVFRNIVQRSHATKGLEEERLRNEEKQKYEERRRLEEYGVPDDFLTRFYKDALPKERQRIAEEEKRAQKPVISKFSAIPKTDDMHPNEIAYHAGTLDLAKERSEVLGAFNKYAAETGLNAEQKEAGTNLIIAEFDRLAQARNKANEERNNAQREGKPTTAFDKDQKRIVKRLEIVKVLPAPMTAKTAAPRQARLRRLLSPSPKKRKKSKEAPMS